MRCLPLILLMLASPSLAAERDVPPGAGTLAAAITAAQTGGNPTATAASAGLTAAVPVAAGLMIAIGLVLLVVLFAIFVLVRLRA